MMREMNPNSPNPRSVRTETHPSLTGLDDFLKGLERLFFAEANVKIWISGEGLQDLVVYIKSPIRLLEALHHHQRGHWGAFPAPGPAGCAGPLEALVQTLEERNDLPVDIEELSLELNDMLIVIRKSGARSIAREFDRLLENLAAHFVYLTRGMLELPYEIYIPVVEDEGMTPAPGLHASPSDFYAYWGVYFESEPDARIYDLSARKLLDSTSLRFELLSAR